LARKRGLLFKQHGNEKKKNGRVDYRESSAKKGGRLESRSFLIILRSFFALAIFFSFVAGRSSGRIRLSDADICYIELFLSAELERRIHGSRCQPQHSLRGAEIGFSGFTAMDSIFPGIDMRQIKRGEKNRGGKSAVPLGLHSIHLGVIHEQVF
jgi:hypothetical protein